MGVLVDVMVHEILVLGQEIWLRRVVIIGAEDCSRVGIIRECRKYFADGVRPDRHIRINEEQDLATSLGCPKVPGPGRTVTAGILQATISILSGSALDAIAGAV